MTEACRFLPSLQGHVKDTGEGKARVAWKVSLHLSQMPLLNTRP
jgi:hypothetical protein